MANENPRYFYRMVGERIKAAREALDMNQKELAEKLGIKDRQTLSAIESGARKVSSAELVAIIKVLRKDLEYFTDPFLLVGEGVFSWRAQAEPAILENFEEKARVWIGTYRTLWTELGEPFNPLGFRLKLSERSSFEDAWNAAEELQRKWNLGETPSNNLLGIAEDKLDILVLYVDVERGTSISGAACHLPEFSTILINRREPDGRRHFDFAHELFHVLTWKEMPPERLDKDNPLVRKGKRVEQLADNFAAALLMPRHVVTKRWSERGKKEIHEWINRTATDFGVTAKALCYWLMNLNLLSIKERQSIEEDRLIWNGRTPVERNLPSLFSRIFMHRIRKAMDKGLLSERRAASLLGLSLDELWKVLEGYRFV